MWKKALLAVAVVVTFAAGLGVAGVRPALSQEEKITICHAAGLEGTTHYITLTISRNAVFGPGGHFNENGTPQAGHEQDYFGACREDTTTTTTTEPPTTTTTTQPPTTTTETTTSTTTTTSTSPTTTETTTTQPSDSTTISTETTETTTTAGPSPPPPAVKPPKAKPPKGTPQAGPRPPKVPTRMFNGKPHPIVRGSG